MKKLILLCLISFSLISCNKDTTKKFDEITVDTSAKKFIGYWRCVEHVIPYYSQLEIYSNGTFFYNYGACVSGGFSEGKWSIVDDTIILKSNPLDSCMESYTYELDCKIEEDSTKSKYKSTIEGCEPEKCAQFYVEFDNTAFYCSSDTLRIIGKYSNHCYDIRYLDFVSFEPKWELILGFDPEFKWGKEEEKENPIKCIP